MRCWINGLPETEIAVSDRGLAYGDGLFETVLVQKGRLHLFEEHLQRLAKGLRKLSFPESVINDLKED
ncbi:4-amino-4-deoxychorismate lyase [Oceanospirillum sp. MED92]|nr:4-amino-4-deoxychorismate lyase [Oceanospirillum sp. MED92] [Neptuniibacter caesariensis]